MKLFNFIRYEFENALIVCGAFASQTVNIIEWVFMGAVRFITSPLVTLLLVYLVLLLVVMFL